MEHDKMKKGLDIILNNMKNYANEFAKMNPMVDELLNKEQNNPLIKQLNSLKMDLDLNIKKGGDLSGNIKSIEDFIKMLEKDANKK